MLCKFAYKKETTLQNRQTQPGQISSTAVDSQRQTQKKNNTVAMFRSREPFLPPNNNDDDDVTAESQQHGGELQRSILEKTAAEVRNRFGTCRFFLHTLTAAKASCICFLRASLCRLYAISMKMRKIPATMPPATSMKTPEEEQEVASATPLVPLGFSQTCRMWKLWMGGNVKASVTAQPAGGDKSGCKKTHLPSYFAQ